MRRSVLAVAAAAIGVSAAGCQSAMTRLLGLRADQGQGWALNGDRDWVDESDRRSFEAPFDAVLRGVDRAFEELRALNGGDPDDFGADAVRGRAPDEESGDVIGPTARSAWEFRTTPERRRVAARSVANWGRVATVKVVEVEGGCEVAARVEAGKAEERRALNAALLDRIGERLPAPPTP